MNTFLLKLFFGLFLGLFLLPFLALVSAEFPIDRTLCWTDDNNGATVYMQFTSDHKYYMIAYYPSGDVDKSDYVIGNYTHTETTMTANPICTGNSRIKTGVAEIDTWRQLGNSLWIFESADGIQMELSSECSLAQPDFVYECSSSSSSDLQNLIFTLGGSSAVLFLLAMCIRRCFCPKRNQQTNAQPLLTMPPPPHQAPLTSVVTQPQGHGHLQGQGYHPQGHGPPQGQVYPKPSRGQYAQI